MSSLPEARPPPLGLPPPSRLRDSWVAPGAFSLHRALLHTARFTVEWFSRGKKQKMEQTRRDCLFAKVLRQEGGS